VLAVSVLKGPVSTVPLVTRRSFRFSGVALALVLGGPVAAFAQETSTAPTGPPELDLEASASFDKSAYDSSETVRVKLTIKNISGVAAARVNVQQDLPNTLHVDEETWGDAGPSRKGVRIEAGATHVVDLTGRVVGQATELEFNGFVNAHESERSLENNRFSAKAALSHGRGGAAATIYADANGNGAFDSGEGVRGVKVVLSGQKNSDAVEQTSDAGGRVVFTDLPTDSYVARYESADGWLAHPDFRDDRWVVEPNKQLDLQRRVVRPAADTLDATLRFHQESYPATGQLKITVTLTNKGAALLEVGAFCSGPGVPGEVHNVGPGWGALVQGGAGVPLAAGETKTIDVTYDITDDMVAAGVALADCAFGPDPFKPGVPNARATAKVLGAVGNAGGRLLQDENSDTAVPGTKIVLVDQISGKAVARAVTGQDGRFAFTGVQTGRYTPVVVGPWRLLNQQYGLVQIHRDRVWEQDIRVVPGPEVADPEAVVPPAPAPKGEMPAPRASGGGLASTGASVIGLSALAFGALAAGVGAMVAVRRKREPVSC
jgi:hypothetical protein